MTPNDHNDRESLSALYDGELSGEARLFALRRLSHDGGWKDDCGRWQLIGDAMRRQAPIAAPADLAERVRSAMAAEAPSLAVAPAVATVATSNRRPLRLWAGGALAASLALVAVVATRGPQPAVAPAAPAVAAASAPSNAQVATPIATPSVEAPALAATATTPADAPPVAQQFAAVERPQSRALSSRPSRRAATGSRGEATAPAAVAVAAFTPPDASNPFRVPANDSLTSHPWPRAALGGNAALTASYGTTADTRGDSPSFYPFEPRLHGEATGQAVTP
ncbi:sigma-E factor negative regulatory protein [Cognatilysobacter terrigena]|uniref:sigma-E factor negative regulatory protein n=1 Tax=Cognatilysobacter terrigena TaxID=2488749 RepID=UPI00105D4EE2|nr:sigma-E factor negative regulatory protein [Lysobacter terrigena]